MGSTWSDVTIRALANSTLVLSQGLLLSRLGLPFAGITLFSGIAAYAVASGLSISFSAVLLLLGLAGLVAGAFIALARPLPEDRYLLLSLAGLALLAAGAGAVPSLGGPLGIPARLDLLAPQDSAAFLPCVVLLFTVTLAISRVLDRSQMGLAIDMVRSSQQDRTLAGMVPIPAVTAVTFALAVPTALVAGGVMALYTGRVDPEVFGLNRAITLLIVTLVAGRSTFRAALVAVGFFVFPDLFTWALGYPSVQMGHVRDIVWSAIALTAGGFLIGSGAKGGARSVNQ